MVKYGCQSMVASINGVLLKKPRDAFRSQKYLDENFSAYGYIESPDIERVFREFEGFEKIIRENVPDVYYLPFDEGGPTCLTSFIQRGAE